MSIRLIEWSGVDHKESRLDLFSRRTRTNVSDGLRAEQTKKGRGHWLLWGHVVVQEGEK